MNTNLKNILVLDIETVSFQEDLSQLTPAMQDHWNHKSQFIRNPDELSGAELFFDKGAIYAEFGKIIVIAIGIFHELENGDLALRVKSFHDDNENVLLEDFKNFIETKFNQDSLRLCTHNGKEFDFPYLCRRWLVNGISIPKMLDIRDKKPWEISHIDTMEMWKFGDYKNFTSLDLLVNLFGIESSKSDIDGSQVNKIYYQQENGLERIAKYCCRDVEATAQLYLKLNNLPIVQKSNITIVSTSQDE